MIQLRIAKWLAWNSGQREPFDQLPAYWRSTYMLMAADLMDELRDCLVPE